MQKHVALVAGAAAGIAAIAVLAGQLAKPPQAFDFNEFEGARQAARPMADRTRRAEAAPEMEAVRIAPGQLEEGIRQSVVAYGVAGAVQR